MTRDELIATLAATEPGGWYPGDEDDERYIDWSTRRAADGSYQLEIGNGGDVVHLDATRAELAELHRALTITLLADG